MNLSEDAPSPIRGNFIPVSGPLSRPSPPRRDQSDVGVHLHLNLTDFQMERLASALPGHYSPQRPKTPRHHHETGDIETIQIGMMPNTNDTINNHHHAAANMDRQESRNHNAYESSRSRRTPGAEDRHGDRVDQDERVPVDHFSTRARASRSRSPAKRARSPEKVPAIPQSVADEFLTDRCYDPRAAVVENDASRQFERRPAVVDNNDATRQFGSVTKKAVTIDESPRLLSQQATVISPATPPLRRIPRMMSPTLSETGEDDGSSYYSEDDSGQAHPSYISPLRVRKGHSNDNTLLQGYKTWGKSPSPDRVMRNRSPAGRSAQHRGLQKTATTGDLRNEDHPHTHAPRNYSPLSDYLYSQAQPSRKELIGRNGWLERTNTSPVKKEGQDKKSFEKKSMDKKSTDRSEAAYTQQEKKGGFLNNLKKLAKDVTTSAKDITSSASRRNRDRDQRVSRLTVSLDPREQSLLYCELEFLLTTALDGYINSQFNAGRLDADKYKKVVDGWQQRGRPKVVGWRYDLETQLDLVLLHSEDFRFYGKRAGMLAAVNGVLDMMRVDARAMRIRTFCQPDTVVAKQLLDAQSLFNLVGCCEQQQIQLAEVIQFFKVILEREQDCHRRAVQAAAAAGRSADNEGDQWRGSGTTSTDAQSKKKSQAT